MATKEEMKRAYKEAPKQAGVFTITNTVEGKVFLGKAMNLHGPLNRHRFQLEMGMHPNRGLQADWKRLGADAFTFEIAEVVRIKDTPGFDLEEELLLLESVWVEKLKPFGARGYHQEKDFKKP